MGLLTNAIARTPSSIPNPFAYRALQKNRKFKKKNANPATTARDLISSPELFSPVGGDGTAVASAMA